MVTTKGGPMMGPSCCMTMQIFGLICDLNLYYSDIFNACNTQSMAPFMEIRTFHLYKMAM